MKQNYPKIISVCCFLFLFVNVGMPSTSFSVYQPYLVQLVGDSGGALVLSVRTLATLVSMFFVNLYYTRLDCRVAVTIGCLLTAAGFFCYGVATSLPLFFVGSLLAGTGYSLGGVVGMTLLTGRWYKARVGTAVGFATVGSGFAGMIVPAVAVQVIHGASLSASFMAEGAFALVVAGVSFAVIRNHPEDIGVRPFGEGTAESQQAQHKTRGKMASHDDARLPRFVRVLLIGAMVCVGMDCVGAMAYLSVLLQTNGFEPGFAALMLSVAGACLTVSKFATGELFDKAGTVVGTVAVFATCAVGMALCLLSPLCLWPLAIAAVAFYGAGASTGSVGISVWALELSSPSRRAKTVKDFQVGYALGGFVGDTFPGFLAEACGSYVPAYAVFLVATVLAGIVITAVYRKYR